MHKRQKILLLNFSVKSVDKLDKIITVYKALDLRVKEENIEKLVEEYAKDLSTENLGKYKKAARSGKK